MEYLSWVAVGITILSLVYVLFKTARQHRDIGARRMTFVTVFVLVLLVPSYLVYASVLGWVGSSVWLIAFAWLGLAASALSLNIALLTFALDEQPHKLLPHLLAVPSYIVYLHFVGLI